MKQILTSALLILLCVSGPLRAQESAEDAGGLLVRLLERTLSDENRTVRVTGLEGALSSRATIERIEVVDREGVWLRIEGAVLDWNRAALIRGRFSVNQLTADAIEVLRQPLPSDELDLPAPEAQPFSMPELPVSILIDQLAMDRVVLDEAVAGVAATLSVQGDLTLADGALDTDLAIERLDRPGDRIALQASYANETRRIGLDLRVEEDAGGLISNLLDLPGEPPVTLTAQGEGPVEDFTAELMLATDGTERLTGRAELSGEGEGDAQAIAFSARANGDLRPLLPGEYDAFFGPATRLQVEGRRAADGGLDVSDIVLSAEALRLTGALAVSAEGHAERVNLDIDVGGGAGAVTLPGGGGETRLRSLTAEARFDASTGPDWTLAARLTGLSQPDFALGSAEITAEGTYIPENASPLRGNLTARLAQLGFADPGLQEGLGDTVTLNGGFALNRDDNLTLSDFELSGTDYRATADMTIAGLDSGFRVDGDLAAEIADLSRFAELAGRDIAGSLSASLSGTGAPLGGVFDFELEGTARGLQTGQETLDELLIGQTGLRLDAERGPGGLRIRELTLNGEALQAEAQGTVRTGSAELTLSARLDDLARILPDLSGPVTLSGSVRQEQQTLNAELDVDAPGGAMADVSATVPLDAAGELAFDLSVSEPAGGPIGRLLNLPDRPALALTAEGRGEISDFGANVTLATQGVERIAGTVSIEALPEEGTAFRADLSGDATPLLQEQFRDFFGSDARIVLDGRRAADGRTELSALSVETRELQLSGSAVLSAEGRPLRAELDGRIAPADDADAVRLPVPGAPVTLERARFEATLDGESREAWALNLSADGLTHPQARLGQLTLRGTGTYEAGDTPSAAGQLSAGLRGLDLTDPGLDAALGQAWTLEGRFALPGDGTLTLDGLTLEGEEIAASADLRVSDLDGRRAVEGEADLQLADLARFSELVGRPLSGAASATVTGSGALSPASFDAVLTGRLQDVTTGIAQADAILAGEYRLRADAATRADGIDLRSLVLTGPALEASASGFVSRVAPDLSAQATLKDMSLLHPALNGEMVADAEVTQKDEGYRAELDVTAPNNSYVRAQADVIPDGPTEIVFDARMNRIERFMPQFPGALAAQGTARRQNGQWQIDADATGPANIEARIDGIYDETDGTVDATARGQLQLALANAFVSPMSVRGNAAFDLALRGRPALDAVSGRVTIRDTSIAVPQIQNTVRGIGGTVSLGQGRAAVDLRGTLASGGSFTVGGPVQLTAPFNGDLAIGLNQLILTDDVVYRVPLSGRLSFSGPLAGQATLAGRIEVGESEINLSNVGGGSSAAPLPPLTHLSEPRDVRATRARAGLIGSGDRVSGSSDIRLDVLVSAPRRIFVRGRGIDAELGGELLIRGTTANVVPSGQIELIRGIMALFGRRLQLDRGLITMQGSLNPYLEFAVSSSTATGSATLEIAGQLNNLEVTITSDPELPEEEALALLLFGNEYSELSPFKIAQIASGLVTLRGGGDFVGATGRGVTGASTVSVAEDATGQPSVELGGYLTENVYTDVTVNAQGDTELNINLDVTDNLTVRGMVDNAGESGIGIFFDRDY